MPRHELVRPPTIVAATMVAAITVGACADGDAVPADVEATAPSAATPRDPAASSPSAPPATERATSATARADSILPFLDDFDDDSNGWGGPYQRFDDGDYVWELPSGQRDARAPDVLIRVEDAIDDIEVVTSFTAERIAAVGIHCAFEELSGSSRWYDLELGATGASIRKQDVGSSALETLATNPDVTLPPDRTEVELLAVCTGTDIDYSLRLVVDGTVAVEYTDAEPFGRAGAPNLSAIALPANGTTDPASLRFHRFEVRHADQ